MLIFRFRSCRKSGGDSVSRWWPSNLTDPPVGTISRFSSRRTVDFPDPDSPMMTNSSPRPTSKETSFTATADPVASSISCLVRPCSTSARAAPGFGPNTLGSLSTWIAAGRCKSGSVRMQESAGTLLRGADRLRPAVDVPPVGVYPAGRHRRNRPLRLRDVEHHLLKVLDWNRETAQHGLEARNARCEILARPEPGRKARYGAAAELSLEASRVKGIRFGQLDQVAGLEQPVRGREEEHNGLLAVDRPRDLGDQSRVRQRHVLEPRCVGLYSHVVESRRLPSRRLVVELACEHLLVFREVRHGLQARGRGIGPGHGIAREEESLLRTPVCLAPHLHL